MELRDKIKRDIDSLNEDLLLEVEKYIKALKSESLKGKREFETLNLKGKFDDVDIRSLAYEQQDGSC
ncbi:hypothetical protein [Hippea alviniae]|uniref:hypothetical protein n=1 Tax=Hippea alviniae TaxID=1279027 RepID=UPI0003B58788|nr:hypothetical protein [Hippea alviniae]